MRTRISERDRVVLDLATIQADALRVAQDTIAQQFEVVLGIEIWDEEKLAAVAAFVRAGGRDGDVDALLMALGVNVDLVAE